jgi:hypothetical protein
MSGLSKGIQTDVECQEAANTQTSAAATQTDSLQSEPDLIIPVKAQLLISQVCIRGL